MSRVLFILLFIPFYCWSQKSDLTFDHLTTTKGLSHNFVRSACMDNKGFMWFATADGINKYDGYSFRTYKNEPDNKRSLSNNDVWFVFEDSRKRLWIATRYGLNFYDRNTDSFTRVSELNDFEITFVVEDQIGNLWVSSLTELFKLEQKDTLFKKFECENLSHNITQIFCDSDNNLWVSTYGQGLLLVDKENHKAIPLKDFNENVVSVVYEDSRGNIWIGSRESGLYVYNKKTHRIIQKPDKPIPFPFKNILAIIEVEPGELWIGTENSGLIIYNVDRNEYQNYVNDEIDNESIGNNSIYDIYKDLNGNIWLSTFSSGAEFVKRRRFLHYKKNMFDKNSLSSNNISAIMVDHNDNLWIGTDGNGLNFYNRKTETFTHYVNEKNKVNSLSNNIVTALYEDKEGYIWIGFWGGGLDRFNPRTNEFVHHKKDDNRLSTSLSDDNVIKIYEDTKGFLWLGTATGVNVFDRKKRQFIHFNRHSYLTRFVGDIFEDSNQNLWIATFDGLIKFDWEKDSVTSFLHDDSNPNSISNNFVVSILEDSKKRLWFCTAGGLNLYDPVSKNFKAFRMKDGLPSDAVYSTVEDKMGNLWIATSKGISHFNPDKKVFKNYTSSDGLQSDFFKDNSYAVTRAGEVIFGGVNGFNIIDPMNTYINQQKPPVYITQFKIFNQDVEIGGAGSPLSKSIEETSELTLDHTQSVFSFEFAALNFSSPEKNQYAYMLEGLEQKWNYVGNKRSATYTTLDPGNYTFRIKASNNDGIWNEDGVTLKIKVTPPYWKTLWFFSLIGFIVVGVSVSIYKVRINNIKRQKEGLEIEVKNRTNEIQKAYLELSRQKEEILEQKEKIVAQSEKMEVLFGDLKDSIRAAEGIQQSILPSDSMIKAYLPESFILNRPKDVVSGDFCWFNVKNDKMIIAAADCTGHGVSGAFMSINSYHLLKHAIYDHSTTLASEILNRLNEQLIYESSGLETTMADKMGVDIALCVLDKEKMMLQFSGARNPLYLVRDKQLFQYNGNRLSIGTLDFNNSPQIYTDVDIALKEGDSIYIFSDGYADQLNESFNQKFMYPRFRDLLVSITEESMENQKNILDTTLLKWRGSQEQLDDVLVIGFRV